ncbi:LysR substrate-binding domain-containing protein [Nesterenkonia haasae]|uniref:LysR substrate-binding domain-containing protein n=1 Tax=Nesterenkonia haasae TaxID=2587813 RepID=UPI00139156F2|nr:LysR substrate-binding domain-containing protein [Nesterenkonia haasae]
MILGAIPGATPDKWAARWRERFPDHALEVKYYDDAGQLTRISEGTVNIGYVRFREHEVEVDTDVYHRVLLYREDPVVCAAADHWIAAAEESVDAAELAGETFLDSAQMLQDWAAGSADVAGAERMALEVAASGAGVVVLPNSVARMLSRKDVVIRSITGTAGYETGLAWLREQDSELIQEFIGIARGRKAGSPRTASSLQKSSPSPKRKAPEQKTRSRPPARAAKPGRTRKPRRR